MDNNNGRIQRKENKFPMKDFCACHVRPVYLFFLYYCWKHVNFLACLHLPLANISSSSCSYLSLSLFFLFSCSSCLLHFFPVLALFFIQFYFRFPIFFSTLLSLQPSSLFNHSMFFFKILLFILSDWFRFFSSILILYPCYS